MSEPLIQKRHLTRQEARQSMQELMANVGNEGWFLVPPASARKVNDLCELVAEDGFDAVKDKKVTLCETGMLSHKYKVKAVDEVSQTIQFEGCGRGEPFLARPVNSKIFNIAWNWPDGIPVVSVHSMSGDTVEHFICSWAERTRDASAGSSTK